MSFYVLSTKAAIDLWKNSSAAARDKELNDGLSIIIYAPTGEYFFWIKESLAKIRRLSVFLLTALLATFFPTTTAHKKVGAGEWIIVRCSK